MGWFTKKVITIDTLTKALQDKPRWRINSTHDSMVDVDFTLLSNTVKETDSLNATGTVTYSVDTDYGGGPGEITVSYELSGGELGIDLDSVTWENVLDFMIIDEQTDEDYGDGELDSDDDWDSDEDY